MKKIPWGWCPEISGNTRLIQEMLWVPTLWFPQITADLVWSSQELTWNVTLWMEMNWGKWLVNNSSILHQCKVLALYFILRSKAQIELQIFPSALILFHLEERALKGLSLCPFIFRPFWVTLGPTFHLHKPLLFSPLYYLGRAQESSAGKQTKVLTCMPFLSSETMRWLLNFSELIS